MPLLAAIVRAQLFTTVILCIGNTDSTIPFRGGALTGSLAAILLARIPIESTFLALATDLTLLGFRVEHFSLLAASWVDNIYTLGYGSSACTIAIELIFKRLESDWDLRCKAQSAEVMACRDCPDHAVLSEKWLQTCDCIILGWLIQSDRGMSRAWNEFKAKLMGAFYTNLRAPGFKKLTANQFTSMLGRALGPIALYYAQTWPPSYRVAEDIDTLQRKLLGIAVVISRRADEEWVDFVRRRSRKDASLIEFHSNWWSRQWFVRAKSWNDHLARGSQRQLKHFC